MASKRQQEDRAAFKRYKEDVAKEGKPFFPYAIFHDTIMSLVVVAVIIGLAVIWKFTADGTEPGALGPLYEAKADPGTTNFVPRPDWFFYFLFYLLRIFKWPETVVLGTVGIPTLLLDPHDHAAVLRPPTGAGRPPPPRRIRGGDSRRHLDGRADLEGRDREGGARLGDGERSCRSGPSSRALRTTRWPSKGATLFAESGCLNCHTYLGTGSSNLGAPDLSAEGAKGQGHRVAGRPPQEPEQQDAGLADAVVRGSRRREPDQDRDVPGSVEGPAGIDRRRAGCRRPGACPTRRVEA